MKRHLSIQGIVLRCVPLLIVALALVLAPPPQVLAQATIVDIATDLTDPSNLADTEPSIAVNPVNPMEIAIVSFSENWGPGIAAPVWKSTDGGTTWGKVFQIPEPVAGLPGPGDQKIAFDNAGNLYVAELGFPPRQDFIYRQTGGPNALLTPGAVYGDDQPHLDVDRAATSPCFNQLYSPWLNFNLTNERSTVSASNNQGAATNNVAAGDNSTFPNRTTRIAIAANGAAYIIYKTREGSAGGNFENAHFRVNRSDDCGATWTGLGGTAGVSVHGAAAVQTFFTTSFGNPAKGKVARARSSDAWIAADPGDGDVYAAYVDQDGSGFGQVYVARSTNQGATWTSTRVTDGNNHSAFPEIAVADNGAVGVLYVDFDDSGTNTIFRHRFARSFDDGATWTDQVLQSMDPGPLANAVSGFLWGDYEGLTALGNQFYGVFTGESIGRTTPQLDPIFFTESAGPVMPTITWNPAALTYGSALGPAQLNATITAVVGGATVTVPGTSTYTPSAGTCPLAAGTHTLTVSFTPTDPTSFTAATASVSLQVSKATPTIEWPPPPDIDQSDPLPASALDAHATWEVCGTTVTVPGSFNYTPTAGTMLPVGTHTLSTSFTPADAANYNPAAAAVQINVLTGHPVVTCGVFVPSTLEWEERVQVIVTIKNDSVKPHATQGPAPGFEYSEGDTFETKGNPSINGTYRIGVDLEPSPYKVKFLYRWGFGHTLAPGESVQVNGYIRFHNSRQNGQYYVGVLEEPNIVLQNHQCPTEIIVRRP